MRAGDLTRGRAAESTNALCRPDWGSPAKRGIETESCNTAPLRCMRCQSDVRAQLDAVDLALGSMAGVGDSGCKS